VRHETRLIAFRPAPDAVRLQPAGRSRPVVFHPKFTVCRA